MKNGGIMPGPEFMKGNYPDKSMSELGSEVSNILALILGGLHHADPSQLKKIDWSDDRVIEYRVREEVATVDGWMMTALVVLAHDRNVRVAVRASAPRTLLLHFMRGDYGLGRDENGHYGHPYLAEHIERIRSFYDIGYPLQRNRPAAKAEIS